MPCSHSSTLLFVLGSSMLLASCSDRARDAALTADEEDARARAADPAESLPDAAHAPDDAEPGGSDAAPSLATQDMDGAIVDTGAPPRDAPPDAALGEPLDAAPTEEGGPGIPSCQPRTSVGEPATGPQEVVTEVVREQTAPLAVYLMIDRSASMIGQCGASSCNPQAYALLSGYLERFVPLAAAADVELALGYFPPLGAPSETSPVGPLCTGASCATPLISLRPAAVGFGLITDSLRAAAPLAGDSAANSSPLECALRGLQTFCAEQRTQYGRKCVGVLASDGKPIGCNVINVNLTDLAADNPETPIVTLGMTGADFYLLDAIAAGSGTDCAPQDDRRACSSEAGPAALVDLLSSLRGKVQVREEQRSVVDTPLRCTVQLPAEAQAAAGQMNLVWAPAGQAARRLGRVSSSQACARSPDAWYFDNATSPRVALMCPQVCNEIEGSPSGQIRVEVGCATLWAEPSSIDMDAAVDAAAQGPDAGAQADAGRNSAPQDAGPDAALPDAGPIPAQLPRGASYGEWTWVETPGAACRDGSPAGYYHRRGNDQLLIMLEGSIGCTDRFLCGLLPRNVNESMYQDSLADVSANLITRPTAARQVPPNEGILKRDERNPLAQWSMIYVPHCTGDLHAGSAPDAVVPEVGAQRFVGYSNFGTFLQSFGPSFSSAEQVLLVGGFGALLNFERVQRYFARAHSMVLVDSAMPFRDAYLEPCLQAKWRALWNLSVALPAGCTGCNNADGGGLIEGLSDYLLKQRYPAQRVGGMISSFQDELAKTAFSAGLDNCTRDTSVEAISQIVGIGVYPSSRYPSGVADLVAHTNTGNFGSYLLPGTRHRHLIRARYFETNGVGTSLAMWVADLLAGRVRQVKPP